MGDGSGVVIAVPGGTDRFGNPAKDGHISRITLIGGQSSTLVPDLDAVDLVWRSETHVYFRIDESVGGSDYYSLNRVPLTGGPVERIDESLELANSRHRFSAGSGKIAWWKPGSYVIAEQNDLTSFVTTNGGDGIYLGETGHALINRAPNWFAFDFATNQETAVSNDAYPVGWAGGKLYGRRKTDGLGRIAESLLTQPSWTNVANCDVGGPTWISVAEGNLVIETASSGNGRSLHTLDVVGQEAQCQGFLSMDRSPTTFGAGLWDRVDGGVVASQGGALIFAPL